MSVSPKPEQTPPEPRRRRIDEFTRTGWAYPLGEQDEARQSIVPFTKADRVRFGPDEKRPGSPARPDRRQGRAAAQET